MHTLNPTAQPRKKEAGFTLIDHRAQRGFTLIELSIVLVIIGLIVGGVLVGQDLIKAAQIRAQVSQIEAYDAAVNTFHNKYNGLPGDLAGAANFFALTDYPQAANCTAGTLKVVPGSGSFEDCAGDTLALTGEPAAFWKQLVDAALIGESLTDTGLIGGSNPLAPPASIAVAFPAAKIGNGNFLIVYTGGPNAIGNFAGVNTYRLTGLTAVTAAGVPTFAGNLTPQEAFQIDTKKDDGLPDTGIVQARDDTGVNFNTGTDDSNDGNALGKCTTAKSGTAGDVYNTAAGAASVVNSRLCELVLRGSF